MSGNSRALQKLADYQKDAIVSAQILKKPTGNITFFAFDEGQELSEHTAPFDAFIIVVEGEVLVRIDETSHHLTTGDTVILPARAPHAVKALTRFKMLLTMIRS